MRHALSSWCVSETQSLFRNALRVFSSSFARLELALFPRVPPKRVCGAFKREKRALRVFGGMHGARVSALCGGAEEDERARVILLQTTAKSVHQAQVEDRRRVSQRLYTAKKGPRVHSLFAKERAKREEKRHKSRAYTSQS